MANTIQPQLPPAAPGQMADDLRSIFGILRRGWLYMSASVAVCLTIGIIYASKGKVAYQGSAGLLVLHQGGRILPGAVGDTFQSMRAGQDSLSTHILIIRSPIIVEQALKSAGLNQLPIDSVIDRLTITCPNESAKMLQIGYTAGTREEAIRVIQGVVSSYENFLKNNYQKNTGDTIGLLMRARDELSSDLARMEKEYLEYRQENPSYTVDANGRSFSSRRLDQWDQETNRAMVRELQLQSQLELARKLISEGVDPSNVATALNRLGAGGPDAVGSVAHAEVPGAAGHSYEQFQIQLDEIGFQRLMAARLLDNLRAESSGSSSSTKAHSREVDKIFESDPETHRLRSAIQEATAKANNVRRIARNGNDPAVSSVQSHVRELQKKLYDYWLLRKPKIEAELSSSSLSEAIRDAEAEYRRLTAKEAALKDTLEQVHSDRISSIRRERSRLASLQGEKDPRVLELDRQIDRLDEKPADASSPHLGARGASLLGSLEQSLAALEVMRKQIQQQFQNDMMESKKAEIGLLAETNLRNNLERQRSLFNAVVDQLKQAQIVSDFGSVTAQVINPPSIREIRPRTASIVLAGLLVGIVAGSGFVYLSDRLDSRIRTLSEMRRVLEISVLGMVEEMVLGSFEKSREIGLICHTHPRSQVSEAYRSIRTNLELRRSGMNAKVILVTSPKSTDGKSITASNLAISLAHAGRSVLLVDADMRRPTQHLAYGLGNDRGLPDVLKEVLMLDRAVVPTQVENLDILTAGNSVLNPAELLASRNLGPALDEMRRKYDVVIVDSPPLLAVADPSIIAGSVDGIIMVIRASTTCRPDVERTLEILKTLGTPVLGAVINGLTPDLATAHYGQGYAYRYGTYGESNTALAEVETSGISGRKITHRSARL